MSFRSILLGVILGLIITSTVATTWLAARGFSFVLRQSLERQIETTLDSVTSRIEDLFLPSRRVIRSFSRLIQEGALPLGDPSLVGTAFAQTLRFESGMAWISFGYPDGSFVGARVEEDSIAMNLSTPSGGSPKEWVLEPDGAWALLKSDSLPESFDARERIWYQLAMESSEKVWTEPYEFASGGMGITVSKAVRDGDGALLGVLTVDFFLEDIVSYLDSLRKKFKGDTLVFAFNGNVIATPQRIRSEEAVGKLRAMLAAREEIWPKEDQRLAVMEIKAEGRTYIVGVQRAEVPGDLECLSTIIFDRAEVFGPVEKIVRRSILAAAIVLVLALVVGFLLAGRIARPLGLLSREVTRIGDFDLSPREMPKSRIREVTALSDSIVKMRSGLKSFSHYVPVDLVRDLVRGGGVASLGGEKREITILFADLAGFTAMAERISPEAAVEILSEYFEVFGSGIEKNGGVIDKFLGDGIMALFNAPQKIGDPDASACRAALQGCTGLKSTSASTQNQNLRVGILTGEALIGNFGTGERFAYTAIGDAVNLCSRLEGLNKYYGTKIIASDSVRVRVGEKEFLWRHLDRVTVVGRAEPLDIHELVAFRELADSKLVDLCEAYTSAMKYFLEKHPEDALRALGNHVEYDAASGVLAERLRRMLNDPSDPSWEGVNRFTRK